MRNEGFLIENIKVELSNTIPRELVEDLLLSFEKVISEYRKGKWEETLWKAGKFAENTFRILSFLLTGKMFITKPIDCRSEILLLLLNSPKGLNRNEIGSILGRYYTQARITQSLDELEKKRYIVKPNDNYIITGPGEEKINSILSTLC